MIDDTRSDDSQSEDLIFGTDWIDEYDWKLNPPQAGGVKTVVLVTMAEVDADARAPLGSKYDRKLSDDGHAQAAELAEHLRKVIREHPIHMTVTGPNYALLQTISPIWAMLEKENLSKAPPARKIRVEPSYGIYHDKTDRICDCMVNTPASLMELQVHFKALRIDTQYDKISDLPDAGEWGEPCLYLLRKRTWGRSMRDLAAEPSNPETILVCLDPMSVFALKQLLLRNVQELPWGPKSLQYPRPCSVTVLEWSTGAWVVAEGHQFVPAGAGSIILSSTWEAACYTVRSLNEVFDGEAFPSPTSAMKHFMVRCRYYWGGNRYRIPWWILGTCALLSLLAFIANTIGIVWPGDDKDGRLRDVHVKDTAAWFTSLGAMFFFFFPPVYVH